MSRATDRFSRALKAADRALVRIVAVTLALLFLAQAMLLSPAVRRATNLAERLEGQALEVARRISPEPMPEPPRPKGRIVVVCESGATKSAILLVNGEEVAHFGERTVSVDVRSGDLVEIDGGIKPAKLLFRVMEVSPGVLTPQQGKTLETRGTIEIVARVKIQ